MISTNKLRHVQFEVNLRRYRQFDESRHSVNHNYSRLRAFDFNGEYEIEDSQQEIYDRNKENIRVAGFDYSTWSLLEKYVLGMPNLVKLSLWEIRFTQHPQTISLPSLKELTFDCNQHFLDVPNLTRLKFRGSHPPYQLIESCEHLTYFKLENHTRRLAEDAPPTVINAISARLTFLDVSVYAETSLIPLLESQKDSVKTLKMHSWQHGEVEFAINHMRLEKMEIHVPSTLKTLKKNTSIKELDLTHTETSSALLETAKILRSCSSIEKLNLHLKIESQATAMVASRFSTNLKHLTIGHALIETSSNDIFKAFD